MYSLALADLQDAAIDVVYQLMHNSSCHTGTLPVRTKCDKSEQSLAQWNSREAINQFPVVREEVPHAALW